MKHTMIPGKCALFLSLHTPDFLQEVDGIFFFIVFYFWSNGPRSDAALPLYDPQSDGRCKTCLPSPIVYTAEETNVYLKWINSCYAVLFIRFIFWALILAYNIACHFLQLTEARLNCPE